jgi:hypothetical protein
MIFKGNEYTCIYTGPLKFDVAGYTEGFPQLFYFQDSWTKVLAKEYILPKKINCMNNEE